MSFFSDDNNISNISFYPDNNRYNNNQSNYTNYQTHNTEINDKEKDTFIESVLKVTDFFYTQINKILDNKNITKYPILNLDNNIESFVDFLKKINSIFKTINADQDEVINEQLCDGLYHIITRDKIDVDFFYSFNDEAHHHNEKTDNKNINAKIKIPFLNCINKLKKKIKELSIIFLNVKDFLEKKCNFVHKLDSRGDFLIPNLNNITKRGKENYNPPYGWIGVGLNVITKYTENQEDKDGDWLKGYKNSKWANAYMGFSQEENAKIKISDGNIKEYLHKIIQKNEKLEIFEKKVDFKNDNHCINKFQKGIYLYPKIENAEKDAVKVTINGKEFQILLMARVKIDEIVKPENQEIWALDKKFIRIYRILFKEIKNGSEQKKINNKI